ncbi:MAG: hypothetical protein KKC75_04985 [Nanoarchaeota archaeon]|nr:hypothetical protein [Nanoarchaeota archaeon]MBU1005861.1 hypothetical protein [Nanoarchaeota archaeon]MBU1946122.1 hypothetical protein [Nanoarchaeota archaeon]
MALIKTTLAGNILTLHPEELLREEQSVESIEEEFQRFLKEIETNIGFHIAKKIKVYIAAVRQILDDIEKIIRQEQKQDFQKLKDLRNLVLEEMKSGGLFSAQFLKRQQEIINQISADIKVTIRGKKKLDHQGIFHLLKPIVDIGHVERLIVRNAGLQKMKAQKELKLERYIMFLLVNLPKQSRREVEAEIISLLVILEQILEYSEGIQIQLSKLQAKRLFLLDYYIHAFNQVAEMYGIQQELAELKQLKERFKILISKDITWDNNLSGFNDQIEQFHRDLVDRIENSGIIYNKREPQLIAVKRSFVMADRLKDKLGLDKCFDIDRSLFIRAYREVYREISGYSELELDREIKDKIRLKRINLCRWTVEMVDTKDMGVWPKFGSIDHFTTCGNLLETGTKINDLIHGTHKFQWPETTKPNLPEERIAKFISIRKHADIIYKLFPIILTEKGPRTRRVNANKWAKENLGFGYKVTQFDIEDGNHRAMAYSMFGIRRIRCFVGTGLTTDSP